MIWRDEDSAQKEQAVWADGRQGRDFSASNAKALGTLTIALSRDASAGRGQRWGAGHSRNGASAGGFPLVPRTHIGPRDSSFAPLATGATFSVWVPSALPGRLEPPCSRSPDAYRRCRPHTK